MATFHPLKINNIKRETSKAVSISFEVSDNLKSQYRFEAGQYLTLKTNINGNEVRRDYSISSSPSSGELTVTIKEIPNGLFSSYANSKLTIGDSLEVATPQGRFTLDSSNNSEVIVGFAAGSGITPIMSLLKTTLKLNNSQQFILIYGNKTPEQTIFYDDILSLKKAHHPRLQIQFLFSQSQEDQALFGRIDQGNTNFILKNTINLNAPSKFFLCGPEGMIHTVKAVLLEKGISEKDINFELFTSSQTISETNVAQKDGRVNVSVLVDDQVESFEMEANQTILEAALRQDIDVPYSCQGGVCSSCICRVTEGTAEMRQNSVLTDSEVAEGLVLSCQAVPTASKIHVDFDDI